MKTLLWITAHFLLTLLACAVQGLLYPFGSRPEDTVLSSSAPGPPLTISVLLDAGQASVNMSVDDNFTLCFNASSAQELAVLQRLRFSSLGVISLAPPGRVLSVAVQQDGSWSDDSSNSSCVDIGNMTVRRLLHAPKLSTSDVVRVATLAAISVVSLAGNSAVLAAICANRRRRQSSIYLLIGALSVADLLVTTFCVVADAAWAYTVEWVAGDAACKLVKFFQMFSLYFSTFLLLVIGYDRFYAVKFPMRRCGSVRRVRRLLLADVLLSALLSLPQAIIFRVVKGPFVEEFYQCVTYGFYTEEWQEQLYTTASLVLMFLLPLFILMFTYICTFYTIAKKENSFSDHPNEAMKVARRNLLRKAKTKALMITVVIMLTFVVCWAPYYSTMIIFIFLKPDSQLSQDLQSAVFFFGSSTAMINPLIYGAFHLRRPGPRRRAPTRSSGSSRAENNTVMQVVQVRKKRSGGNNVQCGLAQKPAEARPQNGQAGRTFEVRLATNSLCSLHSNGGGEKERQQEHSL